MVGSTKTRTPNAQVSKLNLGFRKKENNEIMGWSENP